MKSRNQLLSFSWYCLKHRDQRFWQALRNWSKADRILWQAKQAIESQEGSKIDTFYWK